MFESLVSRLTSPPLARRRPPYHSREVHSEPEDEAPPLATPSRRSRPAKALLDKRRKARLSCADLATEAAAERGSRMDAFKALLPLRQSKSLGRLDGLKEIERLAQYERLTGASACGRRRASRLSDLERVQDLFPQDFLALHDRDVLATQLATNTHKTKSLRKRPSLDINGSQNGTPRTPATSSDPRTFVMEAPVTLRALSPEGSPALERHLFLFSDVLLVAKSRGANCFKLKESVRLAEAWLALPEGDDTGFLIGWPSCSPAAAPIATYIASYPTQAARDSWYRKLQNALNAQLAAEPKSTNIQVVYKDPVTMVECCKTLPVSPDATAAGVVRSALQLLLSKEGGAGWGGAAEFMMCARAARDAPPTVLHGIERPHAIQMSRIRQTLSSEDGFDLEHVNAKNNPCGLLFELKKKSHAVKTTTSPSSRGLRLLLRGGAPCKLFGVPLARVNGGSPPPLVLQMLRRLRAHAPSTHGIFRRSPNLKTLRMLREKLDSLGGACASCPDIEREPVHLLAALVKDFFRSLPTPLLGDYNAWLPVLNLPSNEKMAAVKSQLLKLPKPHYIMLTYFMCLLQAIANKHTINFMCPTNLGVCVGPSLLWTAAACDKEAKAVPAIIEFLIVKAEALFGRQIGSLLGSGSPDSSTVLLDSGAEESDSLHSVGISLDSMELSSPRKEKLSLSRDSGLTLSEDDSNSNGGNSPAPRNVHSFSTPSAARVATERRTADPHNVNGLPQVTNRRYANKNDNYNTVNDEYYAAPYSSERYVHNTIDVGLDRSFAGSDTVSTRHEDIYGQVPAKYITGLEPQKPPRTNISKTARTSKVYSMYSDNPESDAADGNVKTFNRAKSSDNLLDYKQAHYDSKLAASQEILYGTNKHSNESTYGNTEFLGNTNYSRVYTDWEKRSAAYAKSSKPHSDIYGRTSAKADDKRPIAKNGASTQQAATIFTRNDWSRQAARTKSLEVNEDTYVSKCSEERPRGHAHDVVKASACHRRQLDPAHLCTAGCTLRASDKPPNPLQNSYSYVDNRSSPSSEGKKRYRCQNGNQKIAHSKSLANIVLQSDSSSNDTLYQPQGSPFHPKSADSTASENSFDTYTTQYAEPLYTSMYRHRRDLLDVYQKPMSNGDYSDIYTATPTSVRVEGEKKAPHHPPPVPPRKIVYQKVVKKTPGMQTDKESKTVPPYREPPENKPQGEVLALDCSDTDTESESYV